MNGISSFRIALIGVIFSLSLSLLLLSQLLRRIESAGSSSFPSVQSPSIPADQFQPNFTELLHRMPTSYLDLRDIQLKKIHHVAFIAIFSSLSNFHARNAVRATWLSSLLSSNHDGVITYFILSDKKMWFRKSKKTQYETDIISMLEIEQETYGDLLFLSGVDEGYREICMKLLQCCRYVAARHSSVPFFLKVDDDTFVLASQLNKVLNALPIDSRIYWGTFIHGGHVISIPDHRWFNPEYLTLNKFYPSYAQGAIYLVSMELIHWIASAKPPLKVWKGGPEDAMMGTWLSAVEHKRIALASAHWWDAKCPGCSVCPDDLLYAHGLTPQEMEMMERAVLIHQNPCAFSHLILLLHKNRPLPFIPVRPDPFQSLISKSNQSSQNDSSPKVSSPEKDSPSSLSSPFWTGRMIFIFGCIFTCILLHLCLISQVIRYMV